MSEWREKLRLTGKSRRLSLVQENEPKSPQKTHWLADIRYIGGIVHVPDNTRDRYRGFLLGKINASDIKRLE